MARRYKRRIFVYDYAQRKYRISGARPPVEPRQSCILMTYQIPAQLPVPRQTVRVLNTDAMRPAATVIPPSGRKSGGLWSACRLFGSDSPVLAGTRQAGTALSDSAKLRVGSSPAVSPLRRFPTSPPGPGASVRSTDTTRFVAAGSVLPLLRVESRTSAGFGSLHTPSPKNGRWF